MSFVFQPVFSDANPAPGQFGAWIWKSSETKAIGAALSAEEVARVSAMAVEPKRNELARSLGERRHLLAMLLGCAAADLRIAHDNNGKPYLPHYPETKLSLSDSNGFNAVRFAYHDASHDWRMKSIKQWPCLMQTQGSC